MVALLTFAFVTIVNVAPAHASSVILDSTSCASFGGSWDSGSNTCTISGGGANAPLAFGTLEVTSGTTLAIINSVAGTVGLGIDSGASLQVDSGGAILIEDSGGRGTCGNEWTCGSFGLRNAGSVINAGTITIENTGVLNNTGFDVGIGNNGTFTSSGTIIVGTTGFGAGIINLGIFTSSGAVDFKNSGYAGMYNGFLKTEIQYSGTASFSNAGTVKVENNNGSLGGIANLDDITNTGTMTVDNTGDSDGITNGGNYINSGTLLVESASPCAGPGNPSGAGCGVWPFFNSGASATYQSTEGNVTNECTGVISVSNAYAFANGGNIINSGTITGTIIGNSVTRGPGCTGTSTTSFTMTSTTSTQTASSTSSSGQSTIPTSSTSTCPAATLTSYSGTVTISSGTTTLPATVGAILQGGDRVTTGGASSAEISLPDGTRFVMDSDSIFQISGCAPTSLWLLLKGAIVGFVNSQFGITTVGTSTIVMTVRATEFVVTEFPDNSTNVIAVQDPVSVKDIASGANVTLTTGQQVKVNNTVGPMTQSALEAAVIPFTPTPSSEWWLAINSTTSTTSTSSTTSGSGGIPEFPPELVFASVTVLVVALAYGVTRWRSAIRKLD